MNIEKLTEYEKEQLKELKEAIQYTANKIKITYDEMLEEVLNKYKENKRGN